LSGWTPDENGIQPTTTWARRASESTGAIAQAALSRASREGLQRQDDPDPAHGDLGDLGDQALEPVPLPGRRSGDAQVGVDDIPASNAGRTRWPMRFPFVTRTPCALRDQLGDLTILRE
jgi:hypothetical protein